MMIVSVRNIQVVEERRKDITLYIFERVAELSAHGYEISRELLCTLLMAHLRGCFIGDTSLSCHQQQYVLSNGTSGEKI